MNITVEISKDNLKTLVDILNKVHFVGADVHSISDILDVLEKPLDELGERGDFHPDSEEDEASELLPTQFLRS